MPDASPRAGAAKAKVNEVSGETLYLATPDPEFALPRIDLLNTINKLIPLKRSTLCEGIQGALLILDYHIYSSNYTKALARAIPFAYKINVKTMRRPVCLYETINQIIYVR